MIAIGERPIGLDDVRSALAGPVQVRLSDRARGLIQRSAEAVKRLLASGEAIYGVNTGFGKLAKTRIAAEDLDRLQVNIVRSHAAGVGAPLGEGITRLILLLKLNALAQGASGISPVRHGGARRPHQCRCAAGHSRPGLGRCLG
jgi:histidine ammonia-lyase